MKHFLNHINFIKFGYYDSLLMNTPYKLFVHSVNMTQEHIEVISVENSISINGRQHMPEENTVLRYSTNNTVITRHAFDCKRHTVEQTFFSNRGQLANSCKKPRLSLKKTSPINA